MDNLGNIMCSLDGTAHYSNVSHYGNSNMYEEQCCCNQISRLPKFSCHTVYLPEPFFGIPDFLLCHIGRNLNEKSRLLIRHHRGLLSITNRTFIIYSMGPLARDYTSNNSQWLPFVSKREVFLLIRQRQQRMETHTMTL